MTKGYRNSLTIWITLVLPAGTFRFKWFLLTFMERWLIISLAEYLSIPSACKSNEIMQSVSILPLFRMVKNKLSGTPNLSILIVRAPVVA
jgi:hypothetical protein